MSEKMAEMLTLMQRAEKMEYANEELAFKLYIELFENYSPKVSKPYESAIRLYEKRDKLQEALDITRRAIEMIRTDQMTAGIERFTELESRIERKMAEKGIIPSKKTKEKTKISNSSIIAIVISVLALALIMIFATPYGRVLVNLDGKKGMENSIFKKSDEYKKYPITKKMADYTINNSERNEEVVTITIATDAGTIGLGIVTRTDNKDMGKAIVDEALKYLAKAATAEYPELTAPGRDSLGGIYQYYDIVVAVGTSTNETDFYLKGTMSMGGSKINYKAEANKDDL